MSRQLIISILLLLVLFGCREPFEIGGIHEHNRKLVIDAIVTDTGENAYIKLSYTSQFVPGRGVVYHDEDEAIVSVSDNTGAEYMFTAAGNGEYTNPAFAAEYGKQYQLSVRVGDSFFQSGWESLPLEAGGMPRPDYRPDTVQVLSVNGNVSNELAVTITDQITKKDENIYYHWKLDHYYIYDAYGQPGTNLEGSHRFCYISDTPQNELLIHQDRAIQQFAGADYQYKLSSVLFGNKMIYDYAVHIIRYNMPIDLYVYFDNIKKQLENTGGVFDASPSSIQGNIEIRAGEMQVLGFFGVFNERSTRIFFNQNELPFRKLSLPDNPAACPGHHNITLENNCFNCAAVSARFNSTTKPSWWR